MSLNGLDSAAVQEAYQVAIGDPGGWLVRIPEHGHDRDGPG